jgi:BolA protein
MNEARIERLRGLLEAAFQPESLEIEDQCHLHAGHAGAREGKAHFQITIVATAFEGLPPIKRHRLVYAAVGDMLETDIHALIINASAPG